LAAFHPLLIWHFYLYLALPHRSCSILSMELYRWPAMEDSLGALPFVHHVGCTSSNISYLLSLFSDQCTGLATV
jgi:hypothetical protein